MDTLGHIVIPDTQGLVLDGELYAHGISFQENMKLIKKYRKGQTEQVKYHIYDIVMDASFNERHDTLASLIRRLDNPNIELVPTYLAFNKQQINEFHQGFLAQGYEGTMVRLIGEGYAVNKRSSQLLKYKDFLDEVYKVIDVIPSESRPEQGIVVCTSEYGSFNCGMKFPHEAREEILRNKHMYIGQKAEIRFFEFTDGGIPRFPVCVGFRFDK